MSIDIQVAIQNGQGFSYSPPALATATNPSLIVCLASVFNPSNSGKSILIYSIIPYLQNSTAPGGVVIRSTTADPSGTTGFTQLTTPINMLFGSPKTSVASLSSSPNGITASITPTGTLVTPPGYIADTMADFLTNNSSFLLPPGSGIEVTGVVTTAGNVFSSWLKGIEF
jgi:hypothetical protein